MRSRGVHANRVALRIAAGPVRIGQTGYGRRRAFVGGASVLKVVRSLHLNLLYCWVEYTPLHKSRASGGAWIAGRAVGLVKMAQQTESVVPPLDRRLLLLVTYLLYIMVNTVSSSLMPAIQTDIGFSSGTVATIASAQTLAQMFGKICWGGWPVSAFGGTRTYAATMLVVGAFVGCYTLSSSAAVLGTFVFCVEFFSTSTYACHVQIIRGHWSEAARPDGFWLLGVASRSGDVLSKLGWGELVGRMSWQLVCFAAVGLAVGAAALALVWHRDSSAFRFARPEQQLTPAATVVIVREFLSLRMFWVAAAAYSCTTMVKRTNELLLPTYFRDIGLEAGIVDDARASKLSAAWSAGVAASVFVGGHFFAKAAAVPGRQSKLMAALLAVSTISFVILALLPGSVSTEGGLWVRVCLIFTGGTGIGAAYYIPAGMFSTKYGGDNAGVLSCYLDATSFLASALFIKLLGTVVDHGSWSSALWVLALAGASSWVLTPYFIRQLTVPSDVGVDAVSRKASGTATAYIEVLHESDSDTEAGLSGEETAVTKGRRGTANRDRSEAVEDENQGLLQQTV